MKKSLLSMIVLTGAATLLAASPAEAQRQGPKNFVVLLQGTAAAVPRTIETVDYLCFDVDLVDPRTDRRIGAATDCLDAASMADIGDDGGFGINNLTFFDLPGGWVVSLSRTSIQPVEFPVAGVATHITGEIDTVDNIVSTLGTGRFEGATGNTRLNGTVDLTNFGTGVITFKCLFVIDID